MTALAVIWAPVSALARVAEERRVLLGLGITALYAVLYLFIGGLMFFSGFTQEQIEAAVGQLPPEVTDLIGSTTFIWLGLGLGVVWTFVFWLLVSGLMQLVTRFFGGTGPFSGMLAVVGVAQIPYVIAIILLIPLTGLQIVLGPESPATGLVELLSFLIYYIGALLWFVVLVVIGAAFARRVSYGQSTGSCAISFGGCLGLILLLVVLALLLIGLLLGTAGSAGAS